MQSSSIFWISTDIAAFSIYLSMYLSVLFHPFLAPLQCLCLSLLSYQNPQMQLKKPDALSFSKSNSIHPFENSDSLAFWSKKNDASLFLVGLHSKKRPNNLVFARTFDSEVLDMMELGIESFKSMNDYTVSSFFLSFFPSSSSSILVVRIPS